MSPLEQAFAVLFSQTFQCNWQDVLIWQQEVNADGKKYYLDFAYLDGWEKIGIELHGREKFFQYKQVFRNFFSRITDIELQGFKIYHFSWAHVVDGGGWRARKQLRQIFKGKVLTRSGRFVPVIVQGEAPTPRLIPVGIKNWLTQYIIAVSEPGDLITPIPPGPGIKFEVLKGFVIGVMALGIVLTVVETTRTQRDHQPSQNTQPTQIHLSNLQPPSRPSDHVQNQPPLEKKPGRGKGHQQKQKPKPGPHRHPPGKPKTPLGPVPGGIGGIIPEPKPPPPKPQPNSVDEIVAFNKATGIFHNPNSYWAHKCTRNCILIPKSQAIQMGGRPSQAGYYR